MIKFVCCFLCLLVACTLQAQDSGTDEKSESTTEIPPDTIVERRNGILDVFEGNPGRAAIHGLLIPAGGQIYNKRWWKVPLALGAEGAALTYLGYTYSGFRSLNRDYQEVVAAGGTDDVLLRRRNQWRSDRELAWVFWAATHIFVAFEAYIDRHLIEFDVSDDLTFAPVISGLGPVAAVTYSIPLSTRRYQTKVRIQVIP